MFLDIIKHLRRCEKKNEKKKKKEDKDSIHRIVLTVHHVVDLKKVCLVFLCEWL